MKRALVIGLVVAATSAQASMYDGNKHNSLCAVNPQFVMGFVAGYLDKAEQDVWLSSIELGGDKLNSMMYRVQPYCMPENATLGQAFDIYCKFLKDNPAERHKIATVLLGKALSDLWPCKR